MYGLPKELEFDLTVTKKSCSYRHIQLGHKRCFENLYQNHFDPFIDSNFYVDKNRDDEVHFPVLYGGDKAF